MRKLLVLLWTLVLATPLYAATVKLQWDAPPDAFTGSYHIYRTVGNAIETEIGSVDSLTYTFTDINVSRGVQHCWYVVARDSVTTRMSAPTYQLCIQLPTDAPRGFRNTEVIE